MTISNISIATNANCWKRLGRIATVPVTILWEKDARQAFSSINPGFAGNWQKRKAELSKNSVL
jgi:hypothetical protein